MQQDFSISLLWLARMALPQLNAGHCTLGQQFLEKKRYRTLLPDGHSQGGHRYRLYVSHPQPKSQEVVYLRAVLCGKGPQGAFVGLRQDFQVSQEKLCIKDSQPRVQLSQEEGS